MKNNLSSICAICKYHLDQCRAPPRGSHAPSGQGLCFAHYCIPSLWHSVWATVEWMTGRHCNECFNSHDNKYFLSFSKKTNQFKKWLNFPTIFLKEVKGLAAGGNEGRAQNKSSSFQVSSDPLLGQSRTQHFLWTTNSINNRFPPKVYCYNQINNLHANTLVEKQEREQRCHFDTSSWI